MTLVELLVVISIMAVLSLAFMTFLGTLRGADPVRNSAADIKAMIARGRSQSLARNSRFELLLDFEHNEVIPFERRPVAFFGFESPVTPSGQLVDLRDNCRIESGTRGLLDGGALIVGGRGMFSASALLPVDARFNPASERDGISVAFDLRLDAEDGESGDIIRKGSQWSLRVTGSIFGSCTIEAIVRGHRIVAAIPIPVYSWHRIELAICPLSPRLYIDGIPAAARLTEPVRLDPDDSSPIVIGGQRYVPMRVDNLRIEEFNAGNKFVLPSDAWLLPPGASPERAIDGTLYVPDAELAAAAAADSAGNDTSDPAKRTAPRKPDGLETPPAPPLPLDQAPDPRNTADGLPVRHALLLFDDRGQLDLNFHRGPVRIVLTGRGAENFPVRHFIDISIMGAVRDKPSGDAPEPVQVAEISPGVNAQD